MARCPGDPKLGAPRGRVVSRDPKSVASGPLDPQAYGPMRVCGYPGPKSVARGPVPPKLGAKCECIVSLVANPFPAILGRNFWGGAEEV